MSNGRDFISLVRKFQLSLRLTFLGQCSLLILPCFVHLDTLMKYILHAVVPTVLYMSHSQDEMLV